MINMGSWKDTHWPDCWTAVTKDGQPSAQFEHTMVVTESGVLSHARLPRQPCPEDINAHLSHAALHLANVWQASRI